MPHPIKIAAIQMDANPAPTPERLDRAERLVTDATYNGAQLVVLPELFNTGYTYDPSNHHRAERLDGPTIHWMRDLAAYLNVHLAGSLLLRDCADIYNSMLLFSPEERMWRYDKNYPWGWERGYFRPGHGISVAETELGRIGMLVCWDVAHLDLWRQYAGKIDLMLISSCPPDVSNPTYYFPNGDTVTFDQMGPLMAPFKDSGARVFDELLRQQTAWLGVPVVNTVGCGRIDTSLPNGLGGLLSMVPVAPWLVKYLPQANRMRMACDFVPGCKIMDATGHTLSELQQNQGETFTVAEVIPGEQPPQPVQSQPKSDLSPLVYLLSDTILPLLSLSTYRRGVRRAWGSDMAPVEIKSRQWLVILFLGILMAFITGWLLGRRED